MQIKPPVNVHENYHAHVYFDANSADKARELCDRIDQQFALERGRFHEKTVGPHPMGSCQIKFSNQDFDQFVPWLQQNRGDLTVFIHGRSGDDLRDHTEYAYWLGTAQKLNLDIFRS